MLVIGLTGGIGSGKSTVASLFTDKGVTVINADGLAREVVEVGTPALAQITDHFGTHILAPDGSLNRGALRRIVFADAKERVWLEQLLHPLIAELIQVRLAACASRYCILESPLLLETEQHKLVDRVLVVDVTEATQLARTLQRDSSDEATIRGIIASQIGRADRLARADDIIVNEQGLEALEAAVTRLHENYLALAGEQA